MLCGISPPFERLFHTRGQVTHVLLTRSPLYSQPEGCFRVRLACVRRAASVRSEPGSNSPVQNLIRPKADFLRFVGPGKDAMPGRPKPIGHSKRSVTDVRFLPSFQRADPYSAIYYYTERWCLCQGPSGASKARFSQSKKSA
jgi:hypothetical protein